MKFRRRIQLLEKRLRITPIATDIVITGQTAVLADSDDGGGLWDAVLVPFELWPELQEAGRVINGGFLGEFAGGNESSPNDEPADVLVLSITTEDLLDVVALTPDELTALKKSDFSTTPTIRKSARWLSRLGFSKISSDSLPRSIAIITVRSKTVSGEKTLFARGFMAIAPDLQAE